MVIVIMGASGAGKSTIGRALSIATGWAFIEGDDFHPPANVEKMRRGEGLTDSDRMPWLEALNAAIVAGVSRGESVVVACSALKAQYRTLLCRGLSDVRFVYLRADEKLLRDRLASRGPHFAGPRLVTTQLATLEEPHEGALTIEASEPPEAIVSRIQREVVRR